ncbi:DICT sensory domain-containing protein [Pseudonocardia alni]|uniref:Diguanylate cyclase/two-component system sensory protein n=1 Tax=Pseudonocardia alni TaxID=33907 RepID=A0AA44ZQ08_PSEA5|nr:DICT sensory domain-containing protein [Pseudonocardia alni]PKB31344.1 diguanylate cyclase/two-component system sensory protein [Pseudonocardia alni]
MSEGPLAHAVRVASEQAYVDGLSEGRREAWERASGARPEPASKRLLVHLSHSIERAVMSGPREDPTVVVALFQQLRFFDREREVYARMAQAGMHVVVAFADGGVHDVPDGVHLVVLDPDEPLASEWSVVALGRGAGAFLVATDQYARDPRERGEAGRVFLGRWGYARAQAGTELARLRFALGDRLPTSVRRTVDELLGSSMPTGGDPAASAGTTGEAWATTSLNHMIDRLLSARAGTRELRSQLADAQRAAAARAAAAVDPASGLPTAEALDRFAGPAGPETLPVGVALFDLPGLDGSVVHDDDRAAWFAAHQVAAAMTQPLGPVDAALRLSEREFALVVPGASDRHLAGLCDRVGERLALASQGWPGIALAGRVAFAVTATRPLPLADLREALAHLPEEPGDAGPVDAGRNPAGDRIVVAATGREGAPPRPSPEPSAAARHRGPDDVAPRPRPAGNGGGSGDPVAPPPDAHAPPPRPAPAPPPSRPRPYLDASSTGPQPVTGDAAADPRAAAQEALRRLVQGDRGADYDVFADRHRDNGGHPG